MLFMFQWVKAKPVTHRTGRTIYLSLKCSQGYKYRFGYYLPMDLHLIKFIKALYMFILIKKHLVFNGNGAGVIFSHHSLYVLYLRNASLEDDCGPIFGNSYSSIGFSPHQSEAIVSPDRLQKHWSSTLLLHSSICQSPGRDWEIKGRSIFLNNVFEKNEWWCWASFSTLYWKIQELGKRKKPDNKTFWVHITPKQSYTWPYSPGLYPEGKETDNATSSLAYWKP